VASNVVPDRAFAELDSGVWAAVERAAAGRDDISAARLDGGVMVEAFGVARHAGMPDGGVNANRVLLDFLLSCGALEGKEREAAGFLCMAMGGFDGSQFGIACDDGLFSPLTVIGGMVSLLEDGSFRLNVNCRYPTAISAGELERKIAETCAAHGFRAEVAGNSAPFYLDPQSPAVKLLCDIYNEITGSDERPAVMAGGTYARLMRNAVSYGIGFPGAADPEWVGAAHMKNEAISIARAKQACEIFISTLIKLQDIEF
jgi:succinyl-diaminopimelate desuccinylase